MTRLPFSDDRGDTLIEVVVGVLIMGIAMAAIFGGLLTAVNLSAYHRSQSTAGVAVRDYSEAILTYVTGGGYVGCASASTYGPSTVGYTAPTGATASTVTVQYWTGTAWSTTCSPDLGLQQLSLQVAPTNSRGTETLTVVIRKPCGAGSTCA